MEHRNQDEQQAIEQAGLAHVDIAPAGAVMEEDDFLAGAKACSIDDPECESCQ